MADLQPTVKDAFFSPKNESMLQRLLNDDIRRRVGGDLGEKQAARLNKTIHHYMGEVYSNPANGGQPIQGLNKEVLRAVVPDFMSYLGRNAAAPRPGDANGMDRVRMDVSSRYDQMQQERQGEAKALPAPPKFQLSLEDDAPSSLSLFEQAKRAREEEARRLEEAAPATMNAQLTPAARAGAEDLNRRIQSDDDFRLGLTAANSGAAAVLANRDAARVAAMEASRNQLMPVPPDARALYMGEGGSLGPRAAGIATANPTLALPDAVRTRTVLPQDIIKPQDDVLKYKENEYNLFIYSADRDWVNNTLENRYNFTVNFDPANNRPGFGPSPAANIKFKNISRIELVKVIMPVETCEVLMTKSTLSAYETDFSINALSYPYLQVRIDELNTNGYGTNDGLNNSFGVISYDAYWASDTGLKNRGWTRMIPKFLKCQRVYSPTPLATLNKLSIQIQKPDGTQFCSSSDALDVSGVVFSSMLTKTGTGWIGTSLADNTGTIYRDASGEFIWLQTTKWFSEFTITQGDRIILKNLAFPAGFAATGNSSTTALLDYLMRPEGHVVVDIAQTYVVSTTTYFKDGSNKQGYSNWILIRNDFADPTSGSTALNSWATNTTLLSALEKDSGTGPGFSTGRLLNLSHQIQVIFRVITRDMDSATRIRPDNL